MLRSASRLLRLPRAVTSLATTGSRAAYSTPPATIIDGTAVAKKLRASIRDSIADLHKTHPTFAPKLAIVQVGGRDDSSVYIRMKIKAGKEVGIEVTHDRFPRSTTKEELMTQIQALNDDPGVHGIIVQMPLDCENHIEVSAVEDAIAPSKDVDGFHSNNTGDLYKNGGATHGLVPCTPKGVMRLLEESGIELTGKNAVVLGASNVVGRPMAEMLLRANATVTICHIHSTEIADKVRTADVVVAAVGQPEMVKSNWLKPGAVVIDCGINYIEDKSKKSGVRMVGDVAFQECAEVASAITPVPGGVGPMTVAELLNNTFRSAEAKIGTA